MDDLRSLYEEVILDHNRAPRHFGKPAVFNRQAEGYNPICGDEFTVYLQIEQGVISKIGFTGSGCAISTASASLMTESLLGKTEQQAKQLFNGVHGLLTDAAYPAAGNLLLGKMRVLEGVKEYPMRVKCATLAWHTMHAALQQQADTISTE